MQVVLTTDTGDTVGGGACTGPQGTGTLVQGSIEVAHKFPRIDGSVSDSEEVSIFTQEQVSQSQDRQHICPTIYQQRGGHRFSNSLSWCAQNKISIIAVHVPGIQNTLADTLSHQTVAQTEWCFNKNVV